MMSWWSRHLVVILNLVTVIFSVVIFVVAHITMLSTWLMSKVALSGRTRSWNFGVARGVDVGDGAVLTGTIGVDGSGIYPSLRVTAGGVDSGRSLAKVFVGDVILQRSALTGKESGRNYPT